MGGCRFIHSSHFVPDYTNFEGFVITGNESFTFLWRIFEPLFTTTQSELNLLVCFRSLSYCISQVRLSFGAHSPSGFSGIARSSWFDHYRKPFFRYAAFFCDLDESSNP